MGALRAPVATHAHMHNRGAPPVRLVRQAPDHRVTSHALTSAASTPPILTSDPARQHCMVWPHALARHLQPQVIQARERAQVRAIKDSIGHVEVFQMDGVGIPIIERPRPLPGHDTPNPHPTPLHPQMRRARKLCNSNNHISMSEIWAWELRATLLGNQPDWKPTHETTYQHTRRRCDGRRMVRRARASFATRRRAKRDRQVSRAGVPSDGRNNATAATTRGPLHPLRGATPVTGRDTRSEEVHCLRIGCSAPNHKNKRGICETTAETPARGRCTRYGARHPLRGTTPVTGRDTRYGARHPIRRGALPTDRVQRTQSQEQTRNLRDDRRHAQGPGSSRSRGLST